MYCLLVSIAHCLNLNFAKNKREDRGDGWAREQYEVIRANKVYDVEIDTFALTLKECTEQITAFYTSQQPSAFKQL